MLKTYAKILIFFIFLLALASCSPYADNRFKSRLAHADTLATCYPDSALNVLHEINENVARQSEFMRMTYRLVTFRCMMSSHDSMLRRSVSEDSCLQVTRYFRSHGNARHRLDAYNLAGQVLLENNRPAEALRWFDASCRLADSDASVDAATTARCHYAMAQILSSSPAAVAYACAQLDLAETNAVESGDTSLQNIIAHEKRHMYRLLKSTPRHDVVLSAMKLDADDADNVFLTNLTILLSILSFVLACIILWFVRLFRKKKDEEFAANFRNRLHAEEIQDEISSLKKLIQRLKSMLNDEKHANTDSFKTITEQQWRLDRLSDRVSVIDKKEAQRRSMEMQQTLQTDELVIAFHEMALHPVRNVLPTDAQWSALASLVETVAPDFYVIMNRNTVLREEEYRVCILIKAQFKMSEICYLLGIGNSKLTNLRARLLGKVFGKEGGAKDFDRAIQGRILD